METVGSHCGLFPSWSDSWAVPVSLRMWLDWSLPGLARLDCSCVQCGPVPYTGEHFGALTFRNQPLICSKAAEMWSYNLIWFTRFSREWPWTDSSKICGSLQSSYSHVAALTSPNVSAWKRRKAQTLCTCVSVTGGLSSWLCCTAGVFITSNNSMRFFKPRWAF